MSWTKAERILFVDHSAALGVAALGLLDLAVAHRTRAAVALFEDGPFAAALVSRSLAMIPIFSGAAKRNALKTGGRSLPAFTPSPPTAFVLARIARSFGVLYANSPTSFVVSVVAGFLARRPVVWHVRELLDERNFRRSHLRVFIALANSRAARVVAGSHAAADAFVAAGGREQLIRVVHDGIDSAPFERIGPNVRGEVRRALGVDERAYVVGSFDDQSGRERRVLLDALEMLPDVLALVVGSAFAASADEARLIAACDAVVHAPGTPQLSARTLVKAFLGRRPLIASDVSGVREIVEDGVTGLVVPYLDAPALAAAIRGLRDEPVRGDELAFAGWADAQRRFTLAATNASITRVVDDVLRAVLDR